MKNVTVLEMSRMIVMLLKSIVTDDFNIFCIDDHLDDDDASDREVLAKYFGSSLDFMMLNNPIDKCLTISPPSVIMQCIIYICGDNDDSHNQVFRAFLCPVVVLST